MTPAERAYRLALRAYPASYRRERGLEILTTILDGGDGRWPRSREIGAVLLDGVARRGCLASGGTRAGSVRAGVRLAAFAWLWFEAVLWSCVVLDPRIGPHPGRFLLPTGFTTYYSLIVFVPLLALARGRWAVPLAVYAVVITVSAAGLASDASWPWDAAHPVRATTMLAAALAPLVACALARPRAGEPQDRRSVIWLPAAVLAGGGIAWQELVLSSWIGIPLAGALVVAFALARRDPRLAVAAATLAGLVGLERLVAGPDSVAWLGASPLLAPVLIAYGLALVWRLRTPGPLSSPPTA